MQDRNGVTIQAGDEIRVHFTFSYYPNLLRIVDVDGVLHAEDKGRVGLAELVDQAQWVEVVSEKARGE